MPVVSVGFSTGKMPVVPVAHSASAPYHGRVATCCDRPLLHTTTSQPLRQKSRVSEMPFPVPFAKSIFTGSQSKPVSYT